jgi:hypothetical protein
MVQQETVMGEPDPQPDKHLTGDFEILAANLHVDLSRAEQTPNPLSLASSDELNVYWQRLRSIFNARLGGGTAGEKH